MTKIVLSNVVTYKESSPGGCEFQDNWSDFHGRNVPVQYAILVNEGKSMGDTYAVLQIYLILSRMLVCISCDYYIPLKLQTLCFGLIFSFNYRTIIKFACETISSPELPPIKVTMQIKFKSMQLKLLFACLKSPLWLINQAPLLKPARVVLSL